MGVPEVARDDDVRTILLHHHVRDPCDVPVVTPETTPEVTPGDRVGVQVPDADSRTTQTCPGPRRIPVSLPRPI